MPLTQNINLQPTTKLVIFDLDGTLYQKRFLAFRMLCAAPCDWRVMLAERKTRKLLRGKYYANEETFYQTYFQTMANCSHSRAEELRIWYFNRYMPLMVNLIKKYHKPVDWLVPMLDTLQKKGIKTVVLSDYGHVSEKLIALGINKSNFDKVVSAPELGGLKPAPQVISQVLNDMGVSPEECLVIGDREDTDGQLAASVGALFQLV